MKRIGKLSTLCLVPLLSLGIAVADDAKGTEANPLTLSELAAGIDQYEKKEIVVTGKIIGACRSGCKMWVAEREWKEGDFHILVRAKDDAYKFQTDAAGKSVTLIGYAVGKKLDYCAEKGELKPNEKTCPGPGGDHEHKHGEEQKQAAKHKTKLEITFFATSVEYGT
jgi:hypothetical protein